MNFYILTLFPDMINDGLSHSIISRAVENNLISLNSIDIRDYTPSKHKKVDDYPYGGGAGLVMQAEPIYNAFMSIKDKLSENTKVVYMSPKGRVFNQKIASELSKEEDLVILCGHYEGVDQRIIDEIVTDEISIGDYILTGGELSAMVVIDSISRLLPEVLGKAESFMDESFSNGLLEYPQYTRPQNFLGREVPEVLLSGNHGKINEWRLQQSLELTKERRPDILENMEDFNEQIK